MGSCLSKKSSPKLPSNSNYPNPNPIPIPNPNTNNTNTNANDNDDDDDDDANAMEKQVMNYVQPTIWQVEGSKEEQFFDSKAWLESDDEDFHSVYGDMSPTKQVNDNEVEHQTGAGRRLSDLFKERSFSRDTQTSLKAAQVAAATTLNNNNHNSPTINIPINNNIPNNNINNDDDDNNDNKLVRKTSAKRCLPSLVRSLSCGECKKKPGHVAVIG